MNAATARLSALTAVFLIAAAAVVLYVTSHPAPGATQVKAEFEDAFPILAGMDVRESGAIAGSVRAVDLTDRGTAMVTLSLSEGTEPPRSDASVAIRQQDITGDSYLALDPGSAAEELGGEGIPIERTIAAPRFDDLLNSLGDNERASARLLLVETGKALDRRGAGLNEAILRLRPGLAAADEALAQVGAQNRSLRSLIEDTEAVTAQAAPRSSELASLITSLSAVLGETAAHGEDLDRALAVAPEAARETEGTLRELRRTAVAAAPLAETLEHRAPELAQSVERLGPFLAGARGSLRELAPVVSEAAGALEEGGPTLRAAPEHALTAPFDLAGSLDGLLKALLGNEAVLKTLAGADSYGAPPGNADDIGLGSIGVETGEQLGYGGTDPQRNFLRAMVIPSCEIFGRKIVPGCLDTIVDAAEHLPRTRPAPAASLAPLAPGLLPGAVPTDANGAPAQTSGSAPPASAPSGAPGAASPPADSAPGRQDALGLLDFLLGS